MQKGTRHGSQLAGRMSFRPTEVMTRVVSTRNPPGKKAFTPFTAVRIVQTVLAVTWIERGVHIQHLCTVRLGQSPGLGLCRDGCKSATSTCVNRPRISFPYTARAATAWYRLIIRSSKHDVLRALPGNLIIMIPTTIVSITFSFFQGLFPPDVALYNSASANRVIKSLRSSITITTPRVLEYRD